MISQGKDAWIVLVVATAGNYLGAVVNYALGRAARRGASEIAARKPHEPNRWSASAKRIYDRLGPASLLLSWVPFIGDPLTVLAGVAGMPFGAFSFWVALGKGARYAILIGKLLA
ncbi:MAG: DedA family protein [Gemmatimonadetes bacterium]|nr:DedA family protein [Gemmatimonadota bacterium]